MPAVHAIPGSGKTYATRRAGASGWLLDSDDLFASTFGVKATKAAMDAVFANPDALGALKRRYSTFGRQDSRYILLSNVNPDSLGATTSLRVAYAPDDYVPHLRMCGRFDLIDKFGADTLRSWAVDHGKLSERPNAPRTFWLKPGQFLSDIDVIAEQDYEALNRAASRRFMP